jgi:DNA repair photolyase
MDYALNPYVGCAHACAYCYVRAMQRFFHHQGERWGSFIDIKRNAPYLLLRELGRRKKGRVLLASATDCYQPLEKKVGLTRACLEILADARASVSIITKSALIVRDLDLLRRVDDLSVGLTITTDDDRVRRTLEPGASAIPARFDALARLKQAGLNPHVFVGPILPMSPEKLAARLDPLAAFVYLDRMNYLWLAGSLLRGRGWDMALDPAYADQVIETFRRLLGPERVEAIC